jgi:hypothetical protein
MSSIKYTYIKDKEGKRLRVPTHPDGTPMLYVTKNNLLQRTKYKGKLWGLPRKYSIPQEYQSSPATATKTGPFCGVKKDGHSISGKGPCMHTAGWGTQHKGLGPCKLHGGNLPGVTAHYISIQEKKNMALYGDPVEIDPHAAVLNVLHRTAGHVQWLFNKIQALEEQEGDMTLQQYTAMGIKASVWVEMYERERLLLMKAAKNAVDMGVSERQVQLAEEQGKMIAMILQQFIDSQIMSLTPEQRAQAPKVIRQLLSDMPTRVPPDTMVVSPPPAPPASLAPPNEEDEWEEF